MSWIKNKNGEEVYVLSDYAKEELPTWIEIYEDFYLGKLYDRVSYEEAENYTDLYWKIPHKKFIMMVVCNQFNKILKEDGYQKKLIEAYNEKYQPDHEIENIIFGLSKFDRDTLYNIVNSDLLDKPMIYTITHPKGKPNPFILSNRIRINDKELDDNICLGIIIQYKSGKDNLLYETLYLDEYIETEKEYEDYMFILEFLMKDIRSYFEGEGIGWKDEDGNLIDSDKSTKGCPSGYDPAL